MYNDYISIMLMILAPWQVALGGTLAAMFMFLCFYQRYKLSKLRNAKAELQQTLNERSELLKYALERERKSKDNASEIMRSKSLILARINHEIRTPLNGVLGMVSLLNETKQTAEQRDYTDTIRDCSDNLLKVVNDILYSDILAFSKVDSGKFELEQVDFDLENSIEGVLEMFASKAAQKGVELLCSVAAEVPKRVTGDHLRLQQILMNLIENSVRNTSVGQIVVQVERLSDPVSGGLELGFEILDSGTGIAPAIINALDERSGDSTPGSVGVGLAIVKKLVELMKGTLSIKSSPEEGTCIRFTIRLAIGVQAVHFNTHEFVGIEGSRVIVAVKNDHTARVLEGYLKRWKLTPLIASSGKKAIEILSDQPADLCITDLNLPDMTGPELVKDLKGIQPQLPAILLTWDGIYGGKHPELFSSILFKPLKRDLLGKHILSPLKHQDDAATMSTVSSPGSKLPEKFSASHPLRILVAEDNPTNQKLAMKVLAKLGFTPDIANHGKEVLEMVSHKTYDLILMDVQMPFMDGMEASRMIRLCLSNQPVIVAMTANTLQGDREECIRAGMDDYISKPVKFEELVGILEKWAARIEAK